MEAFQKIQLAFKCPKALDDFQPCQNNWYCDGCQKMVYDFRGFSEDAILNTFAQSGQKLCGIYDADRIKVLPQKPRWYKWTSAAVVVFGLSACNDYVLGERIIIPADSVKHKTVQHHKPVAKPKSLKSYYLVGAAYAPVRDSVVNVDLENAKKRPLPEVKTNPSEKQ